MSVVLPTLNRPRQLARAVDSVREQTFSDWELIIVDDGSRSRVREAIDGLADRDERLRIVHHPENRGVAAARNTAIQLARGHITSFLDDDCVWPPDYLSRVVEAVRSSPEEVGIWCATLELRGTDGVESYEFTPRKDGPGMYPSLWSAGTPVITMQRRLLMALGGFDEHLPRLVDFDLWVRASRYADYATVPGATTVSERGPDGITCDDDALLAAIDRLTAKVARSSRTRHERAVLYRKLGEKLIRSGYWWRSLVLHGRSLASDPAWIRGWMAMAAVCGGQRVYELAGVVSHALSSGESHA